MNECSWWDPDRHDWHNRASVALKEDQSRDLVIGSDNPSRGWTIRKGDRGGHKRFEYEIHHLAALCYNGLCSEQWQREIANSLY